MSQNIRTRQGSLFFLFSVDKEKIKSLRKSIVESLKGTEQDFTKGGIGRALLLLSIPMILEMVMESVFALVDIIFVSKLGAEAVAMVGITESLMTIIYAICVGFSAATTALVARRIGEKKNKEASVAAFQAIFAVFIISLVIAIPSVIYVKDILALMGASDKMIQEGYWYPVLMLGGNVVIMLLFVMNAIFRGAGDAAISMRVLMYANLINIFLDPMLIFGIGPFPELGLAGAAVATNIGRGTAVVYQFYLLFKGNARVKLYFNNLRIKIPVMLNLLKLSMGGIGQHLIATSSWIVLVRIIAEFGSNAVAGYTIALRILIFSILPSWGLSNAASTLVGQNLGAGKPERAERSVWVTLYANLLFLSLIGIVLIVFAEGIIGLIINDPVVIAYGKTALIIFTIGLLSYGAAMVFAQSFNGAGDTFTPTLMNFGCYWIIELSLAWYLTFQVGLNEQGTYWSVVIAETILAIIGFLLFKKGKWKTRVV